MRYGLERYRSNPSVAVLRLEELQDDQGFTEDQRNLIRETLDNKVSSGKGSVELMESILKGDMLNELDEILNKSRIGASEIKRMRELFSEINNEVLIVSELGSDAVRKYFKLLEGRGKSHPYYFPVGIKEEHLEVYLDFDSIRDEPEIQADIVAEFINDQLRGMSRIERQSDFNLGCNLTISLLRAHPVYAYVYLLYTKIPKEKMERFLADIDIMLPRLVIEIFEHLFNEGRKDLINRYMDAIDKKKKIQAKSLLKKLRKMDTQFFGK